MRRVFIKELGCFSLINQMSYNFTIKVSGKNVVLKKYSQLNYFNYTTKNKESGTKGKSNNMADNFYKSIIRARQNVFDLINCNVNVIPDFNGKLQLPKFLTLTFKENITDIQDANKAFTNFNKRLSYRVFGTRTNVLKYLCIPEFQKRGAIHYHVLYFNLPYIDFNHLKKIWGNGSVFIEGVKDNIDDFALYVAKYINKTNSLGEENYLVYQEKGLLNQKRYFCSRGLNRPDVYKLNVNKTLYEALRNLLNSFHTEEYEYTNDFIGNVVQNTYELNDNIGKKILLNSIDTIYDMMKEVYNKPLSYIQDIQITKRIIQSFNEIIKYHVVDGFHEVKDTNNYIKKIFGVI